MPDTDSTKRKEERTDSQERCGAVDIGAMASLWETQRVFGLINRKVQPASQFLHVTCRAGPEIWGCLQRPLPEHDQILSAMGHVPLVQHLRAQALIPGPSSCTRTCEGHDLRLSAAVSSDHGSRRRRRRRADGGGGPKRAVHSPSPGNMLVSETKVSNMCAMSPSSIAELGCALGSCESWPPQGVAPVAYLAAL